MNSLFDALRMRKLFQSAHVQELWTEYSKGGFDALRLQQRLGKEFSSQDRLHISEWLSLAPKVAHKFQSGALLCDRLAYEQSTGKSLALWKASLWPNDCSMADLCCGMGGDSLFLPSTVQVIGVDLDPFRIAMFKENTLRLGTSRGTLIGNALHKTNHCDFFQIDPARRSRMGQNQRKMDEIQPSWPEIQSMSSFYAGGMIKLPPAFPLDAIAKDAEILYVGEYDDCKECLVLQGQLAHNPGRIRAVVLPGYEYSALRSEVESFSLPVMPLGKYLIEPNPVLVRSHLFPLWAKEFGFWQIDHQIAYLSGDTIPEASPWFHAYEIVDSCPLGTQRVRSLLKKHGLEPMTLKKRGVEVDVEAELRMLRKEKGKASTLVYTRISGIKMALLTLPQ